MSDAMKTVTEFSGFQLRGLLDKKREMQQGARKPTPANQPKIVIKPVTKTTTTAEAPVTPEAVATQEAAAVVDTAPAVDAVVEPSVEAGTETAAESVAEPVSEPVAEPTAQDPFRLYVVETTKFEGQKLEFLFAAIQSVDRLRVKDLKRVVVLQGAENAPTPKGAVAELGHFFLPEYLPSLEQPKGKPGKRAFGGKDGKGRGKGGKGGRGGGGRRGEGGRGDGGRSERGRNDSKRGDGRPPQHVGPAPKPSAAPKPNATPKTTVIAPVSAKS